MENMKKMMPLMMIIMVLVIGAFIFVWQGVAMHAQVPVEEAKLHALQDSYFTNSKVIRDSAETGSQLNKDLIAISQYPSTLLELKLVGVGKMLTGIFVILFVVVIMLFMVPIRFGRIIMHMHEMKEHDHEHTHSH